MADLTWTKSSLSGPWTDNCVEVAYTASSLSGSSGNCVETHQHGEEIHLRDSKNPKAGFFTFNRAEWDAFIGGVKAGEFDY